MSISKYLLAASPLALLGHSALAAGCDVSASTGDARLSAASTQDGLMLEWTGSGNQKLRLALAGVGAEGDRPVIRSLDLWQDGWQTVIRNAEPTFSVKTGLRRMSNQQMQPLRELGVPIDQAVLDKYRWEPFWDAPLDMHKPGERSRFGGNPPPAAGVPGTDQTGLPRDKAEVAEATARFIPMACVARREGSRITVDLAGVKMGAFEGKLRFTIYAGSHLIRQEILATTSRKWLAYKFTAGLRMAKEPDAAVAWRDNGGNWQADRFASAADTTEVPLVARNRVAAYQQGYGALAFFPEPHKFFWAREVAINMGYQWIAKGDGQIGFGIRQNDTEDDSEDPANWALYNARPGTVQRMPMFLLPTLGNGRDAVANALRFTRDDTYKPLPGYKVLNHHYHTDLAERVLAHGTPDVRIPDLVAMKATGINIVSLVDSVMFTAPGAGGPPRRAQADPVDLINAAFAGAAAQSDDGFLVWPNQEVFGSPLGGHTDLLFAHKVLWRKPSDPAPKAGVTDKVYQIASATDLTDMAKAEGIMFTMPHPRTKGSTGFPDAMKDRDYFLDPQFAGVGLRWGMGLDGSEERLCEFRCWPLMDDMSNWMSAKKLPLKRSISISEVRHMGPGDDVYGSQPVTYIKMDRLPKFGDFSTIITALKADSSFWTTGEVLLRDVRLARDGKVIRIAADVEWTFPLEFVEVVYGDGQKTHTKRINADDQVAESKFTFTTDIPAKGVKWVRVGAWDIASNGAVGQPVAF